MDNTGFALKRDRKQDFPNMFDVYSVSRNWDIFPEVSPSLDLQVV